MHNLYEKLKKFSPKQKKTYIEITLPIVLFIDGGLLDLRIKQESDGYMIWFPRNLFYDANGSQEFYYNIFENYDNNYHYDIQIKNGKIFKKYPNSANITVSVNEFIRYFILLDDFILENDVIGHEENFNK